MLQRENVAILGQPERLPREEDFSDLEKRLKIRFPESYRSFCLELGPGRFGDLLEIIAPWPAKGFFKPCNIRSRLDPFIDAAGVTNRVIGDRAIQFGFLVFGDPPVPRPICNQSGDLFFLPSEPADGDELAIYAIDRRVSSGKPARLVKIAQSFTQLITEGFVGKKLLRLPFVAKPAADQLAFEFRPDTDSPH